RRLHAGRRSASRQASSELRPRPTTGAWFRRRSNAFDTSSTVHSRSSYQRTPDEFSSPFPQRSTTPAVVPAQLAGVWTLILQSGSEGPTLISRAARLLRVGRVTSEPPLRAVVAHCRRRTSRRSYRRSG